MACGDTSWGGFKSYSVGARGGGWALVRASRLKFCWLYARQTQHAERRSLKGTFAKGLPQRRGWIVSGVRRVKIAEEGLVLLLFLFGLWGPRCFEKRSQAMHALLDLTPPIQGSVSGPLFSHSRPLLFCFGAQVLQNALFSLRCLHGASGQARGRARGARLGF